MRRPTAVELMLLAVVVLWALNLTVTRYILTNGFEPLAYATVRYGLATLVFVGLTLAVERSLWVARRDWWLVLAAALALWLNQLAFVYALEGTSASTIGLILGATPIFAALLGLGLGTERPSARFWFGAAVSFAGRRPRRRRLRQSHRGWPRRDPARAGDGRVVGRVLGRDHAADEPLLAVPDQLARALDRLGADRDHERDHRGRTGLLPRLVGVGAARLRNPRAARDDERALVPLPRPDRPAPGRRSRRTCSRSWRRSSRSCCSRRA